MLGDIVADKRFRFAASLGINRQEIIDADHVRSVRSLEVKTFPLGRISQFVARLGIMALPSGADRMVFS